VLFPFFIRGDDFTFPLIRQDAPPKLIVAKPPVLATLLSFPFPSLIELSPMSTERRPPVPFDAYFLTPLKTSLPYPWSSALTPPLHPLFFCRRYSLQYFILRGPDLNCRLNQYFPRLFPGAPPPALTPDAPPRTFGAAVDNFFSVGDYEVGLALPFPGFSASRAAGRFLSPCKRSSSSALLFLRSLVFLLFRRHSSPDAALPVRQPLLFVG